MKNNKILMGILTVFMLMMFAYPSFAWFGDREKVSDGRGPAKKELRRKVSERADCKTKGVKTWRLWGNKNGREKVRKLMDKELDLTDKQKAKFKSDGEKLTKGIDSITKSIKENKEKLVAELRKEKPDRKNVHKHIRENSRLRADIHIKRMDSMLEFKETLTKEQRAKFNELLNKNRGTWRKKK